MGLITKYWSIDLLMTCGSLIFLFYLYMIRNFEYWKKLGVMEITPTAFIGNFGDCLKLKRSAGEWLHDIYNYGAGLPYMGFYVFDRVFFLPRDPELIKSILVKDYHCFQDRFSQSNPADPLAYKSLFLVKNPVWKYLRTKLTPIYTSGRLKKMFELMIKSFDDLNKYMESLIPNENNHLIEVKEICAKFSTDVIATTAFGLKVNSFVDPNADFRRHGREIFNYTLYKNIVITSTFFAPQFAKPMKFKFFSSETTEFLRKVLWSTMRERERSGVNRDDLLDLLLELRKTQAHSEKELFDFDGDNIVAQAALFFIAGYETTATTLSFLLYELALNPEIQLKARNEILNALRGTDGKITYDKIIQIPYLEMVVSETLRKYPPISILDRLTGKDYKVPNSDLILKKGIPVHISISGLHYDPQYFPNPQKFDPERFTPENKKTRPSSVYLPFGDGPHNCIGLRVGLLEVKLTLITILQKYELSPCKQTLIPMRLNPRALFTASDGGIFLIARRITAER